MPLTNQQNHVNALITPVYTFSQYKADMHAALSEKFGVVATSRKNKCIRITEKYLSCKRRRGSGV